MVTQTAQITITVDELLTLVEPLIRRVVREELANIAESKDTFHLKGVWDEDWLTDLRARHPFAKMSKEEILKALRETRDCLG
jgi:allophanate hydrolase subunit 1